jgi:AcrR family transcriptional regulator
MDYREIREHTIKEAKCGLILDAADRLFLEKGYSNTRIDDIAEASGFSKPSLYSYFPDKESIFLSLAIRELRKTLEKMDAAADSQASFCQGIDSMVRILVTNFSRIASYQMTATNLSRIQTVSIEISKHGELTNRLYESFNRILAAFEKIIARARAQEEITDTIDTATIALFIFSLNHGVHMQAFMTGIMYDIDTTVKNIVDFIKHGVGIRE